MKNLTRRDVLRVVALWGTGSLIAACAPFGNRSKQGLDQDTSTSPDTAPSSISPVAQAATAEQVTDETPARARPDAPPVPADSAYLAVVRGPSPAEITTRAIAAIGGMERFVKNGYDVIIKPNICNGDRDPEYATTTNPEVVATLVKLCLGAGAKRVRVMDTPISGTQELAHTHSGIAEAVKAAGGEMELMSVLGYADTPIPEGRDLKTWTIYQSIFEADLLINVPIAKQHGLATLTLGGKNLMGTLRNRQAMHRNLGQRIADIASVIRPELTVMDAVRILLANGPTGGNLDDVKRMDMVIASHDIVAVDAYTTSLFGKQPADIAYIKASHEMGLGTMELDGIKIAELDL